MFGSARTATNDPLYAQATEIAKLLAARGWMVVTGAGPGIMQAAMEGAGRAQSIGVSIRLPFEQGANPVIAGDEKYVSMKYFFTRKLILVKESRAFVCLPGGFGTLDETFELLTLTQTGKGLPVPIIFLDTEGDTFWSSIDGLIRSQLVTRNLVAPTDTHLYFVTDSCEEACTEIERFYANYDSIRYVGNQAVIRLRFAPTDEQLAALNSEFAHLVSSGRIERTDPLTVEVRQNDRIDLPRIRFQFAKHKYGDLRAMIDVLNDSCVTRPPTDGCERLEQRRRLLDGTTRLGQRLVLRRAGGGAVGDRLGEDVEGDVVELAGDAAQLRRQHRRSGSCLWRRAPRRRRPSDGGSRRRRRRGASRSRGSARRRRWRRSPGEPGRSPPACDRGSLQPTPAATPSRHLRRRSTSPRRRARRRRRSGRGPAARHRGRAARGAGGRGPGRSRDAVGPTRAEGRRPARRATRARRAPSHANAFASAVPSRSP